MAITVFPTENNVGTGTRICTEENMAKIFQSILASYNYVVSGFQKITKSGLTVTVEPGVAVVDGHLISFDTEKSKTVNDDTTNEHWYLSLHKDGSDHVDYTYWQSVVDPALDGSDDPSDGVKIFSCTTADGQITELISEKRNQPGFYIGEYVGNGAFGQVITLGFHPVWVLIIGFPFLSYNEGSIVWNPPNIVNGSSETSPDITVPGAAVGDRAKLEAGGNLQGLTPEVEVTAANTALLTLYNYTGGDINLTSRTFYIQTIRSTIYNELISCSAVWSTSNDALGMYMHTGINAIYTNSRVYRPRLTTNGFTVSGASDAPNLNQADAVYRYFAIA